MSTERISLKKQALIDWATNLKAEEVDVKIDFAGGGSVSRGNDSGDTVLGYTIHIDVAEVFWYERDNREQPALNYLVPSQP